MMMIVLRPPEIPMASALQLPNSERGVFSGGGMSVDSWTLGPKPLCHRHPTGPHPSGLLWTPWTPAKGDSTKSSFALAATLALVDEAEAVGVGGSRAADELGPQDVEVLGVDRRSLPGGQRDRIARWLAVIVQELLDIVLA